jgi:hypothetical protein
MWEIRWWGFLCVLVTPEHAKTLSAANTPRRRKNKFWAIFWLIHLDNCLIWMISLQLIQFSKSLLYSIHSLQDCCFSHHNSASICYFSCLNVILQFSVLRNVGCLNRYIVPTLWRNVLHNQPLLWSSGQEFLAIDSEVRVRFLVLPDVLRSSGSVTGSTEPR